MTLAYVALGSNLNDPRQQVLDAMAALAALPGMQLLARSSLYLTLPWGVLEQPAFVNAVVLLDTSLTPHALLDALLELETRAGRVRAERNGPRTLDLDVLHFDGVQLDDARLTLPHPRLSQRAFVLLPLHDIAPALEIPTLGSVRGMLEQVDSSDCKKLA